MRLDFEKAVKSGVEQAMRECELTIGMTLKEAVEKQIPKKPIFVDVRYRYHGRYISDGCSLSRCYKCPGCGDHIFYVFDTESYCSHCGQALEWGDEYDR